MPDIAALREAEERARREMVGFLGAHYEPPLPEEAAPYVDAYREAIEARVTKEIAAVPQRSLGRQGKGQPPMKINA